MKEEILVIRGNNSPSIEFTKVKENTKPYGLFTYKGNVYVFKEDFHIPFEELLEEEQKEVLKTTKAGDWKVNKSLQ
ncbi:MAG: hypothetical protein E6R13_06290 [Spirochaetes bacterium]|nr:MAG: hypothetical protein E6R13_06290 [Spirochaetota bacterium]